MVRGESQGLHYKSLGNCSDFYCHYLQLSMKVDHLDGGFFILLFCELIAASLFYEYYPSRGRSTTWRGIFLDTLRAARQNTDILLCDSKGSQQFNIFLMDMDTCDYNRTFNKAYFITCKYICCIKTLMNMTVRHM